MSMEHQVDLLRQDCLTEAYYDVQNLIYDICHRFQRKYHRYTKRAAIQFESYDKELFEELVAEANLQFIKAFDKYDGTSSKLSSWVRHRVPLCLLEGLRRHLHRNDLCPKVETDLTILANQSRFDLGRIAFELSEDAGVIIKLLTEDNPEFTRRLGQRTTRKRYRKEIKKYLRESGWSLERVKKSFKELAGAFR